ncbi:hypothetical protein M407DRAFT_7289 [Tulasnella calospora MUT 4182]|uniref:Uncharacterized protein n=1 Tax=Tulasnella calospora MUT 4182 TaxID=1051891 RepID=A0A0C3QJQ9_9AGAM|nr:hypothetical protein M407DRAFT_7289 [Tulasnella calospora MUT 4182]
MEGTCIGLRLGLHISNSGFPSLTPALRNLTSSFQIVTKKKGVIFSSNGTNPGHVTRLRNPSLSPRALVFNDKNQLVPFEITDPWDHEALPEDKSNTLIPITPLLDAARQLRYIRHGGEEEYKALMTRLEGELKGLLSRHLFDAAIGMEKAHRQLDRDARLFLAVEVAKYRKKFRGEETSASNETKAYKDRVFEAAFDRFPDLAPQNRVFKTPEAQVAYKSQHDIYFRGHLSACDKKDGKPYSSKRISQLEEMFLEATKRRKTALDAWLGTLEAEDDLWKQFEQKELELTDQWLKANPNGDLGDNRLQLERAAKRGVFKEKCKKDPELYDRAKNAAKDLKANSGNVTAAQKAEDNLDALAFLNYVIARITDRADLSVTVIAVIDCGDASPNAYINEYGYPRGQALVDKSEGSDWNKNVNPLISDFVKRISAPGQNTTLRFGEVLPKVEGLALERQPGEESEPESHEMKLVPYNWDAERSVKRAKTYFDTNLRKLRGLTGHIMWKSITKNPKLYLHGLPDIVLYETNQFDRDGTTGKIIPHPITFRNPSDWDEGEFWKWEDHISKSEAGELPVDQAFAFVDASGRRYYACSALGKSPIDDVGDAAATANTVNAAVEEEAVEDFTDQMAQVQPIDDGDMSDSGGDADMVSEEEARKEVMMIKNERMEKNSSTDNLTAPASTSAVTPTTHIEGERRAVYPRFMPPGASEDQLHSERRIRRSLEVIQWKGFPSPVPKGPQLSSTIEAILLDELLCFKDLLPEEFDAAREFAWAPRALTDAPELAQVLGNTHYERLLDIEQSPPPIQSAEDLYGPAFDSFLITVLSAVELAIGQLFSDKGFLHLRLGGPRGLIIIFRALSFLFPVLSRASIKTRFEWAAVRLHYFTILALSVRRSFLPTKAFLGTYALPTTPSSSSSNPLSTVLRIWEDALTVRLQMWSSLIMLDDLQSLTQVANPNVFPQRSSGTELYLNITELRWYHVPAPGTPWQIAVPVPSSSSAQTLEFLQTVVAEELSIGSLCYFATSIFALMVAASSTNGWEADPAWPVLIGMLRRSLAWQFQPPIDSCSSEFTEDIEECGSSALPEGGDDIHMADGEHRRSGTPISPCLSPKPNDIITGHFAAMRPVSGPMESEFDGAQEEEDMDLITQAADQSDNEEWVDEGDASNAIADKADAPEAVAAVTSVGDREPKKRGNARVPVATQRVLRTRNAQVNEHVSNPKRKSTDIADADTGNEPGPSAAKRPRTRTEKAKQLELVENPALVETPDLKTGRTKPKPARGPKAAAKPRQAAKAQATSKPKAPSKPKANSKK